MTAAPHLSPIALRELLRYDPDAGKLFSKSRGREVFTGKDRWGYPRGSLRGKYYLAHRVAWALHYGTWPDGALDHIDRDKTNFRISNLRLATATLNNINKGLRKDNTSGVSGVGRATHDGASPWYACIRIDGKRRYLGHFASKEAAVAARLAAEEVRNARVIHHAAAACCR